MKKQISTVTGIVVIIVVAVIAFGGVFAYKYFAVKTWPIIQTLQKQTQTNQTTNEVALLNYEPKVFDDGSIPSTWETAGFNNPQDFKRFFQEFQLLVANNDKQKIAELINYPITIRSSGGGGEVIKDTITFIADYDTIFNQTVKSAVKNQNIQQIWRNYEGAMTGNGELWFNQMRNGVYKIIAINN